MTGGEDDDLDDTLPRSVASDTLVDGLPDDSFPKLPRPLSLPPSVLAGRYALGKLLGSGTSGAVYEARDELGGDRVAVKVLRSEHAGSKELVARFFREARIASEIGHPGIVQVYDSGRDPDGRAFIAMELLEGHDLADAMETKKLDVAQIVGVAKQVLSVLEAAHRAGIVHRDVKPENVWLGGGDPTRVKLLDFGIAKLTSDGRHTVQTQQGTTLGTPHYMSPEQCRGDTLGPTADVYAVGAMMFHCLAGAPPHDAKGLGRLLQMIVTTRARPLATAREGLPAGVCAAVDRALAIDPAERFPSAEAMSVALG